MGKKKFLILSKQNSLQALQSAHCSERMELWNNAQSHSAADWISLNSMDSRFVLWQTLVHPPNLSRPLTPASSHPIRSSLKFKSLNYTKCNFHQIPTSGSNIYLQRLLKATHRPPFTVFLEWNSWKSVFVICIPRKCTNIVRNEGQYNTKRYINTIYLSCLRPLALA